MKNWLIKLKLTWLWEWIWLPGRYLTIWDNFRWACRDLWESFWGTLASFVLVFVVTPVAIVLVPVNALFFRPLFDRDWETISTPKAK